MMNIHWTLEVHVPQLDALTQTLRELGEHLVETVETIIAEMQRLNTNLGLAATGINQQLTRIADEAEAYGTAGTPVTPAQMTNLGAAIRKAADDAGKLATDIEANTQAIGGIVPDAPPTP